jgi:hypothetical protein
MTTEHLSKHRTPNRRSILLAGTALAAASALGTDAPTRTAQAQQSPATLTPSPSSARALPPGPDARVKITEEYAKGGRARRLFLGLGRWSTCATAVSPLGKTGRSPSLEGCRHHRRIG